MSYTCIWETETDSEIDKKKRDLLREEKKTYLKYHNKHWLQFSPVINNEKKLQPECKLCKRSYLDKPTRQFW